jgi:RNA ligase (TIGR02306 family)
MSRFEVKVRKIEAVEPHPKADRLEFARVEGYRSVVKKGEVKAGELVVYLPEAAVLPEFVLRALGLWNSETNLGMCAGEEGNRVKVVVLRGYMSQGIVFPLSYLADHPLGAGWYLQDAESGLWPVQEGDDVAGILGITKHVPVVPDELSGAVMAVGRHLIPDFDIEDIKKYPRILEEGEDVFITEKLHGILTGAVFLPEQDAIDGERFFVFGKGIGHDGLAFIDDDANKDNVYLKAAHKWDLKSKVVELANRLDVHDVPVFLIGETFGIGVQDLGYGIKPDYRAFAIGAGYRGREKYVDYLTALDHAAALGVQWVPELYRGPFSKEILDKVITGKETLSGNEVHMREGGVIEPKVPRQSPEIGRVALKAISPDYLRRPGNTTEYQ